MSGTHGPSPSPTPKPSSSPTLTKSLRPSARPTLVPTWKAYPTLKPSVATRQAALSAMDDAPSSASKQRTVVIVAVVMSIVLVSLLIFIGVWYRRRQQATRQQPQSSLPLSGRSNSPASPPLAPPAAPGPPRLSPSGSSGTVNPMLSRQAQARASRKSIAPLAEQIENHVPFEPTSSVVRDSIPARCSPTALI